MPWEIFDFPLPEEEQHRGRNIWQHQLTAQRGLATSDGEDLKVVYPGKPNSDKGPDFLNAIITSGKGGDTKGDIEVHVKSSQWKAHGHHQNPGYNDVVLHVVMWDNQKCHCVSWHLPM
ncbi:DUF2851 family protein [Chloroflexota bacterium]